ncbi:MAG: AbrB family transcriptional regulator [Methylovirgula sp.]
MPLQRFSWPGNLVLGLILLALTGTGLTTAILSTSPGGLAEMSLTAIALKADVSLVVAFHLARTLIVALSSLPLYAATRRLSGHKASP